MKPGTGDAIDLQPSTAEAAFSLPQAKPGSAKLAVRTATPFHRIIVPITDVYLLTVIVLTVYSIEHHSLAQVASSWKLFAALIFISVTIFFFYIFGIYDRTESKIALDVAYRTLKSVLLATSVVVIIYLLLGQFELVGMPILLMGLLTFASISLWHMVHEKVMPVLSVQKKILLVCNSKETAELALELSASDNPRYELAGCIDQSGGKIAKNDNDKGFVMAAEISGANTVVIPDEMGIDSVQTIASCNAEGLAVVRASTVFESVLGKLPLSHAALLQEHYGESRLLYHLAKRFLDFTAALAGIMFLIVVFLPIAAAIRIDSRGPIFYPQVRSGKNGRRFTLYKFRTMVEEAEASGPRFAIKNDERITKVGLFLRRTHLDELPQFLSIFKGDLSLVGPRPERPEIIDSLESSIPLFGFRYLVRPGITGWAQVCGTYAASIREVRDKLQYDLFYVKNQCFFLDLIILFKTAKSIIQMRGR